MNKKENKRIRDLEDKVEGLRLAIYCMIGAIGFVILFLLVQGIIG